MKKIGLLILTFLLLLPLQTPLMAQVTSINSGSIYTITSKASKQALNVTNSSLDNNANVEIWTDTKSDAQRWIVTSIGDDLYTITNVASGRYLHIASTIPTNLLNVNQYAIVNNNTIKWKIVSNGDGYFTIQSAANTAFVLNVSDAGTADGTNVSVYQSNAADAQSWAFYVQDPQDQAPTAATADKAFAGWRKKYYDNNRSGNEVIAKEGFWGVAEMMEIVDDSYEVTGNVKYSSLFNLMYNAFISKEGSDWMWNDYNDDISWMVIACTRASLLTGNTIYQKKAKEQFDKMWARAYSSTYGGGLLWKQGQVTKNACINGPAMVACCYLAQAFNDPSYYVKALSLYNWSKLYLINTTTGKVNDGYDGTVHDWSSTYNQGTYLGATVMLYNYTKDPEYLLVAQRIAQYTKVTMFQSKVIDGETGSDLNGFKGIYMRYARRYVVDCNRPDYIPWLQLNAKIAYNNRNSEDLIFTKWGTKTVETAKMTVTNALTAIPAFAASTAVSLLMNCPLTKTLERNPYQTVEAESFDYLKGVRSEACPEGTNNLSNILKGYYTGYNNLNFGYKGAASAEIRLSSITAGNTIEIRLGSPTGTLIGTATIPVTTDWNTYTTITCPVTNVKGLQNVYLVYQGAGTICKINYFRFVEATTSVESNGLLGSYYNGVNFQNLVLQRIDSTVNFNWGEFSPGSTVNLDNYSARWTGKIQPRYTGTYTFYINSDNGRKVWIDNQLIVDKWTNEYGVTYSGTIDLIEGQKYDFKVEYYETNGGANIKLEWESPEQVREVIPSSRLFLPDELPLNITDNKVKPSDKLSFYPNPVKDQLTIELGNLDIQQVSILDIQGRILIQSNEKCSGTKSFIVSELPKGIYFVKVLSGNGVSKSLKFIK